MVFDTGAGITTVSSKLAARLGLKPDPADQKITLKTADGTEVEARLIKLKTIRVGKLTVSNVECAVMPEGKEDVDSLLGQSFFKQFKVEFSHEAGTLALKRLETGDPSASTDEAKAAGVETKPSTKAATKSRRPARQPRAASKRAGRTRRPQAESGDEPLPSGGEPN
jgi:clan AA aspartic protease (TIGR02281 family)